MKTTLDTPSHGMCYFVGYRQALSNLMCDMKSKIVLKYSLCHCVVMYMKKSLTHMNSTHFNSVRSLTVGFSHQYILYEIYHLIQDRSHFQNHCVRDFFFLQEDKKIRLARNA